MSKYQVTTEMKPCGMETETYLVVVTLDDLKEESRTVLARLGEDLKQVALVVVVDQNVQLLQNIQIFLHVHWRALQLLAQGVVVGLGDLQELDTTRTQLSNSVDHIGGVQSNMLHTTASVIIHVFLDLALAFAIRGFVDGHLDVFFPISHHNRSQRTEFSVNHLVVHRPEAMELQRVS